MIIIYTVEDLIEPINTINEFTPRLLRNKESLFAANIAIFKFNCSIMIIKDRYASRKDTIDHIENIVRYLIKPERRTKIEGE